MRRRGPQSDTCKTFSLRAGQIWVSRDFTTQVAAGRRRVT